MHWSTLQHLLSTLEGHFGLYRVYAGLSSNSGVLGNGSDTLY